jgi:predicted ATPase
VLRVASVVGVTFAEPVVADVLGDEIQPDVYTRLADASLIVAVESPGAWRFSHPLIHDAAYLGLLASARRQLHTIVADRLEASNDRVPISVVARHRAAAEDVERAVPLLARAAEEAAAVGASAEAASFWTAAADLEPGGAAAGDYRQRARAALEAVPAGRSASMAPASIDPTPLT